jgi:hypothetical protein
VRIGYFVYGMKSRLVVDNTSIEIRHKYFALLCCAGDSKLLV